MEKVTYWVAEDGTKFDDRYECEEYEERLSNMQILECFSIYDRCGNPIDIHNENAELEDIEFILVKKENYEDGSYAELDDNIYDNCLPSICDTFGDNDIDITLIYYDHDFDCWCNWHEQFNKLTDMMEKFQLFGGK